MQKLSSLSKEILSKLPTCALLVSGTKDDPNVMTVGWGTIGYMWGKPVIAVPVRKSRFSHELMELNEEFAMCFPAQNELDEIIKVCGSTSKRDSDKFTLCNLTLAPSKSIQIGNVKQCSIIIECKKIAKVDMPTSTVLDQSLVQRWYPNDNPHTIFYGEILDVYKR